MKHLIVLAALLSAGPAFAQDAPAAPAEPEAPHFLLGDVGVRIDLPEEGWKNDHWSDWDFKSTSDDGVVLVAWTTPYQVTFQESDLAMWEPVYTHQADTLGGKEPKLVSSGLATLRGDQGAAFELTMGHESGSNLVMFANAMAVEGQTLHLAAVALDARRDLAKSTLDGVIERLEIQSPAEALTWGGPVTAPGLDATLDPYWRLPLKKERAKVMEAAQGIGIGSVKGCWMAIHPHPPGKADLMVACQDKKHVLPIVDAMTFPEHEEELRMAWLGESAEPGQMVTLSGRESFLWAAKVGTKAIEIAAIPNELGLGKVVAYANKGDVDEVNRTAKATLEGASFSKQPEVEISEWLRYYVTYKPTSPVVLGPIIGALLILLGIIAVIIFGLRRQAQAAREEMDETY